MVKICMNKKCLTCLQEFTITLNRATTAKYCSVVCRAKYLGQLQRNKNKPTQCRECLTVFYKRPSRQAKYCSSKCRVLGVGKQRAGIPMSPEARMNMSKARLGKPNLNMRGEKHWAWKGGKNKNRHKGTDYIIWRKAVFEKDNYVCQVCSGEGYLNAHHVKSWAEFPTLRFDVSNGKTLCINCHAGVHVKYSALIYGQLKGGVSNSPR